MKKDIQGELFYTFKLHEHSSHVIHLSPPWDVVTNMLFGKKYIYIYIFYGLDFSKYLRWKWWLIVSIISMTSIQYISTLRPSTAYMLLQLAQLKPGDIVLDSMCGVGTIPAYTTYLSGIYLCILSNKSIRVIDIYIYIAHSARPHIFIGQKLRTAVLLALKCISFVIFITLHMIDLFLKKI